MTSLIQQSAAIIASDTLTENKTLLVRGIFTNDLIDRQREVADPLQFNLEVFQNTATLLRNHKTIKDNLGNDHAAGKVIKTLPIIISQENPDNSEEWVLKSLVSEDIVALWPKTKSPNMLIGDRGIYVIAEVTHPEVIKQVLNKELGAFSWSGLTRSVKRLNGITDLTEIDLLEVSLVNIPANPDATFLLTDENDPTLDLEIKLKDCDIYQLKFDKTINHLDTIKKITKQFNIDTYLISENDDSFFIKVGETNLVEPVKCFTYDLGQWKIVAAPKMMNKTYCKLETIQTQKISEEIMSEDVTPKTSDEKVEAIKLYLLDVEAFMKANPKAQISVQKTVQLEEAPVEISFIELPVFSEPVVEPVAVSAIEAVVAPVEEAPASPVAEAVAEPVAVAPVEAPKDDRLDKLTELVANLTNVVSQSLVAKQETEIKEKTLEEVKAELQKDFDQKLEEFKKDEEHVETQRALLQKSLNKLAAFESSVPDEPTRNEKVESEKSFEPEPIDAKAFFANRLLGGLK